MYHRLHNLLLIKHILIPLLLIAIFCILVRCDSQDNNRVLYTHEILGMEESCLDCHSNMSGFSASHNPKIIGCTSCHLGDPKSPIEKFAHEGMVLIPGNLRDVHKTCGSSNCHMNIVPRIENSLMTTLSGMINVDKYVLGESNSLNEFYHVGSLGEKSPADKHLRQLCVSCHLGNPKEEAGPISEKSRGGGCNACHLNYKPGEVLNLKSTSAYHPSLDVNIGNDKCFGCHSRSGRISTSYEGWHETTLESADIPRSGEFRVLADKRVFQKIKPDVHHIGGMECIDCHPSTDIMGDGKVYLHQEDAVKIECLDCHQKSPMEYMVYDSLDIESKKLINLRGWTTELDRYIVSENKQPLYNVTLGANDSIWVRLKNSSKKRYAKPANAQCTDTKAHSSLSCQACHTGWAPQCIGCHYTYEAEAVSFDHIDKTRKEGKWIEHIGEFYADLPLLGKQTTKKNGKEIEEIKTFISGMILSIDYSEKGSPEKINTFHRLFAPVDPHTTQEKSRSCTSCHLSPLAIGYGRGSLFLNSKNEFDFNSEFIIDPRDGLPQDAWIDFKNKRKKGHATRANARAFNEEEQNKILRVGACLTCHRSNSPIMQKSLNHFEEVIKSISDSCKNPDL